MLVNKAYKFRIYPTKEQEVLINKTIGCTRLVYNIMLSKKKINNKLNKYDLIKEIPILYQEYPFLKEADSMSLRCAIIDLCNGFDKYYKKTGGYPKFKKKGNKDSYRTNLITSTYKGKVYENIKLDLKEKIITLPKLKEVKIRGYRHLKKIDGRIINVTIERLANKYYVSVCVEENIISIQKRKEEYALGIDIGVSNIVVTSDKEYYGNPRYLEKYERKIKGLQKGLSRKVKGSKNYNKNKIKIQEVYRKLKNARKKLVEEIVSKVTRNNDIIITERLKVKGMLNKKDKGTKKLRKEIINATFSEIIRKLEYKCRWLNKIFYQVDTYYPSSQICNRCGNVDKRMKDIRKREYKCSKCNNEIERDLNASINIMYEGICSIYKERYSN